MQQNETEAVVTPQQESAAAPAPSKAVETSETSEVSDQELEAKADSAEDSSTDKKESSAEKRIKKLLKERSKLSSETEYWKSLVLKQNQNPDKQESEPQKAKPQESSRPDPNTFEGTHAEYLEALTDWKIEQREKAREAKEREVKTKTEVQTKVQSFQSKVSEFSKAHEDFQDLIDEVDDIRMSLGVQEAILESDVGPEVMYELAKNRKEYERINALSPIAAAREIGKIEARLNKESAPESSDEQKQETKKITKAPKPLEPVGKGPAKVVAKSIDDPNLPFTEYVALRREQLKKRRG